MTETEENYFKSNKELWNKKTSFHKDSDFYDLEGFKKGKNVLTEIELSELTDVTGKNMLHLQCHFGLDSMSWARLGAKVTGVDFSDEAIGLAKELSQELNLDAEFVCSDIYNLKKILDGQYDIIFTSFGVIGWLPDMDRWADIIAHFLKPGGTFYMAEFHPVVWMFDDDFKKLSYSYFNKGVLAIENEGTYADKEADIKHTEFSWNHSLSEVITALTDKGLQIEFLHEFDYSPYNCFPDMVKRGERKYYFNKYEGMLPVVYSVKATKTQ